MISSYEKIFFINGADICAQGGDVREPISDKGQGIYLLCDSDFDHYGILICYDILDTEILPLYHRKAFPASE